VQLLPNLARSLHRAPDVGLWGIFIEEHHDLAGRTLPGVSVLQSPGALTKDALAPGTANLDRVIHGGDNRRRAKTMILGPTP
jgi:hypothetical protein